MVLGIMFKDRYYKDPVSVSGLTRLNISLILLGLETRVS